MHGENLKSLKPYSCISPKPWHAKLFICLCYKHNDINIFVLWDDLCSLGKHSRSFEGLKCLDLQGELAQEDGDTTVP